MVFKIQIYVRQIRAYFREIISIRVSIYSILIDSLVDSLINVLVFVCLSTYSSIYLFLFALCVPISLISVNASKFGVST